MKRYKNYTIERVSDLHYICRRDDEIIAYATSPQVFLQLIYTMELDSGIDKPLTLEDFSDE